ncbi:FAD-binding domain-containing protein [Roseibium sp. RKSG952]|uniref:FAD-binding domain-containing protein n=1 Tax=Roseibium sp. RKSG952 TaxID=2529384 RepID=UPI0012BD66FC|nr:FAD-binding domain-containing protein [Roseibium sp. RKSG952]MTH96209.1 deoxyribodipyrimidine photolyase [Roseibium sp. RKSG952]
MVERPEIQIVWFKRDLRVQDHAPLTLAARHGAVLPLFVFEPELWAQADMSGRHLDFVRECLGSLRADLAALGQPLIVRKGDIRQVLDKFSRQFSIGGLWSHEETGNRWTYLRDLALKDWCLDRSIPWHELRQTGVIRRLKNRDGWAGKWDRFMAEAVCDPAPLPPLPAIDPGGFPSGRDLGLAPDPCPARQTGGRRAAEQTLYSFLHERGGSYRAAMATPVLAFEACSRISPHLAWGTMSMREAAQATRARQQELKRQPPGSPKGKWQAALRSFSGRLHWHCHFMQKLEDAPNLEFENLHPAYDGLRPGAPDAERLAAWQRGETGLPFVDACMRALAATGWMNFRMRAMLVAVSSYHLWLDWRQPGLHLARLFTDYEPGIHWPQVQMQSGTTGINTVRIYNPVKQGKDQDPDGCFVRTWLPELRGIAPKHIHEPWKADNAGQVLGKSYPFPIADHLSAARAARDKVWGVRQGADFRQDARSIQTKHGSRKSGLAMRGQTRTRRPRKRPADGNQPDLFGLDS